MARLFTDPRAVTDMSVTDFSALTQFRMTTTPTTVRFTDFAGNFAVFTGTGIALAGGVLTTQSISGYTLNLSGINTQIVTGLNLGAGELESMLDGAFDANSRLFVGSDTILGGSFNDVLIGFTGNDFLYGRAGNDGLNGEIGNDRLYGQAGSDNLIGGSGFDLLVGGDGADRLDGGSNRDVLAGGNGADTFIFGQLFELGVGAAQRDRIRDFSDIQDRIDLSNIDANAPNGPTNETFNFIGRLAFNGVAGQLRFATIDLAGTANDITVIAGDVNGDKYADFRIELAGVHVLNKGDFFL